MGKKEDARAYEETHERLMREKKPELGGDDQRRESEDA